MLKKSSTGMSPLGVALLILTLVPAFGACNKPRKVLLSKRQKQKISNATLDAEPSVKRKINARFDESIRLVGVDIDKKTVKPGSSFNLTFVWEALVDFEADGPDWKMFVHVDGGGRHRITADHHAVGGVFPIRKWPKGKFIKYTQRVSVPKDAKSAKADVWVGIYNAKASKETKKDVRMKVSNPKEVRFRRDRSGRLEVGHIQITGKKGQVAKIDHPEYAVYQATEPIVIDGVLGDAAWKQARQTRNFLKSDGHRASPRKATWGKFSWDQSFFYAAFVSRDADLYSALTKDRDAKLWTADAIELYLDPGVTHKDYVELQFAPTGKVFDAHFSSRRKPAWPEASSRLTMSGMKVAVKANGSVNVTDDKVKDRSWTLEVAIPWTDLPTVTGPPKDGDAWGMNLYRVNVGSPPSKYKDHLAWSAAFNDFHNTNRWGTIRFSIKRGRSRDVQGTNRRSAPPGSVPGRVFPGSLKAAPSVLRAAPVRLPSRVGKTPTSAP